MNLYLEVLDGPLLGKKYKVRLGLVIGRREGEILLNEDGKVSGLHAKIDYDSKEQFILVDQGSANGLIFEQKRVPKVSLLPNITFRVGDTSFKVQGESSLRVVDLQVLKTWRDHIHENLNADPEILNMPKTVRSFSPPLRLEFTQGQQSEQFFELYYGPRSAGFMHFDLDLHDTASTALMFQISPVAGAAMLVNHAEAKLRINKKPVSREVILNDGDQIEFGTTILSVRYL
jgi:pSer/pThr/pTyr-binding forkhead associated (FHA) protein